MFYGLRYSSGHAALAYVVGVMLGDGSVYPYRVRNPRTGAVRDGWRVELDVTDESFAQAFADALTRGVRRPDARPVRVLVRPEQLGRKRVYRVTMAHQPFGQWCVDVRRDPSVAGDLLAAHPAAFLRGLYDSEGNLRRELGWYTVRIFSQAATTLDLARAALRRLDLDGEVRVFRPAGTAVRLPDGRHVASGSDLLCLSPVPARRFLDVVGSSIPRKAA